MILVKVEGNNGKELLKLETCNSKDNKTTDSKRYKEENRRQK